MGYKILKGAMVGILLGVCGGILLTSVLHIAGGGSVRDVVSLSVSRGKYENAICRSEN